MSLEGPQRVPAMIPSICSRAASSAWLASEAMTPCPSVSSFSYWRCKHRTKEKSERSTRCLQDGKPSFIVTAHTIMRILAWNPPILPALEPCPPGTNALSPRTFSM